MNNVLKKLFLYTDDIVIINIIDNFITIAELAGKDSNSVDELMELIDEHSLSSVITDLRKIKRSKKDVEFTSSDQVWPLGKIYKKEKLENSKDKVSRLSIKTKYLARLYYHMPFFGRDIPPFIATQIINFHRSLLELYLNNEEDYSSSQTEKGVLFFIRMLEIQITAYSELNDSYSQDDFIENLQESDYTKALEETKLEIRTYVVPTKKKKNLIISSHIGKITENMMKYLQSQIQPFKRLIDDSDSVRKKRRTKSLKHDVIDTTRQNLALIGESKTERSTLRTTSRKDEPTDEVLSEESRGEERQRQREYVRAEAPKGKRNSPKNQKIQAIAVSNNIAKNKAMLPSLYSAPTLGNLSNFLRYAISAAESGKREKEQAFYLHLFVLSVLLGLPAKQTWDIFYNNQHRSQYDDKSNSVKIKGVDQLFAAYEAFGKEMGVATVKDVSYKLPFELIHYKKYIEQYKPADFDLQKIEQWVDVIKKKYPQTIHFTWSKIWSISHTHKLLLDPIIDISTLIATGNRDVNHTPRLVYGSFSQEMETHSYWLDSYLDHLKLKSTLQKLLFQKEFPNAPSIPVVETKLAGSRKMIKTEKVISYFNHLKMLIKKSSGTQKFNLISIYVRFAATFLVGTRDFSKSSNITRISFKRSVMLIQEKTRRADSGNRLVPLCKVMLELFKDYYDLLDAHDIKERRMSLIINSKRVDATLANITLFLKTLPELDEYEAFSVQTLAVALNSGRHLYMNLAITSGLNLDDIKAYFGHATNGSELLGERSIHDTATYLEDTREILDEISFVYGITRLNND